MKIICTASQVNRLAEGRGYGVSNCQVMKPLKSVIQLRNVEGGGRHILISTNKDVKGQRFDVAKVGLIRDKFITEGMVTIEMVDPPMNLMLKNANPGELAQFVASLRGQPPPNTSNPPATHDVKDVTNAPGTLRKLGGPSKRARSPEISKVEVANIKQALKRNVKTITITTRSNYPLNVGFPPEVVHLTIMKINLRRIDPKILALKNLAGLDLSNNIIGCVNKLKNLDSRLQRLTLANNRIEKLDHDFFLCKPFRDLIYLDLRQNQLKLLPNSIVYLPNLQTLLVGDNKLECLPFNTHFLRNLTTLKVQNNKLSFIPSPLIDYKIRTSHLIEADVSDNPVGAVRNNECNSSRVGSVGCPSLLEIAAETVLNHSLKSPEKAFFTLGPQDIPKIVRDYLDRAKICDRCYRMTVRYSFRLRDERLSNLAENASGRNRITVKGAHCHRCLLLLKRLPPDFIGIPLQVLINLAV